jgi:hypothetical protein
MFEKVGGPIGGEDCLPKAPSEPEVFVPFLFKALNRQINTPKEINAAYAEMSGETLGGDAPALPVIPVLDVVDEEPTQEKKPRGRPKKAPIVIADDDDDEKDEDDDV